MQTRSLVLLLMIESSATAVLPVWRCADDELALSAADGDHGVDGLETGHHRLAHGLAVDDAWGETLDGQRVAALDGPMSSIGWPSALTRPIIASPRGR